MFNKMKKSICTVMAVLLLTLPLQAYASESVTIEGLYRHPITGNIEDSGGESSEALGQSMVSKMTSDTGTYDESTKNLDLTFFMMNSISDVNIQVQFTGTEMFTLVDSYQLKEGNDEATYRIPLAAKSDIVRIEAFIEPMGRAVVFYVVMAGELDGVDFTQTPQTNITNDNSTSGLILGGPDVDDVTDVTNTELTNTDVTSGSSDLIVYGFLFCTSVTIFSGIVLITFTLVLLDVLKNRRIIKDLKIQQEKQVFQKKVKEPQEEEWETDKIVELLKENFPDDMLENIDKGTEDQFGKEIERAVDTND